MMSQAEILFKLIEIYITLLKMPRI